MNKLNVVRRAAVCMCVCVVINERTFKIDAKIKSSNAFFRRKISENVCVPQPQPATYYMKMDGELSTFGNWKFIYVYLIMLHHLPFLTYHRFGRTVCSLHGICRSSRRIEERIIGAAAIGIQTLDKQLPHSHLPIDFTSVIGNDQASRLVWALGS